MENTAKLYTPCLEMNSAHEVTEDFTLPDYMPAIQRLISCRAQVLPESRSIRDGEAVLSGIVAYTVLYIGEDGGICSAPLNSEYTARLACRSEADMKPEDFSVRTGTESVQCRITAPRRLSVTCRMRSRLFGSAMSEIDEKLLCSSEGERITPADAMSIERRRQEAECCAPTFSTYTGGVTGEFRENEETRVLCCDGTAGVNDVKLDGKAVVVRGEVYVNCLVMDSGGEYSSVRSKAPFEERVTVTLPEGVPDDARTVASACVRCASVSVSGGDSGVFTWEAEYDIDVTASFCYTCSVTQDAFSTAFESSHEYTERTLLCDLRLSSTRMSLSSSRDINGEGKSVITTFGRAVCESCECDGAGHAVFSGTCTASAVLAGDGEAVLEEVSLPFSYKCDACDLPQSDVSRTATASVLYTDARLDGNRLVCDAEITVEALSYGKRELNAVTAVTLDKASPVKKSGSLVTVCYPYSDESIWDICKRYRCEEGCISRTDSGAFIIQR